MNLRPISEAPQDGRPVLVYFEGRKPRHQFAVMYFDESAYLWYTAHGRIFLGPPSHFVDLDLKA